MMCVDLSTHNKMVEIGILLHSQMILVEKHGFTFCMIKPVFLKCLRSLKHLLRVNLDVEFNV